MSLTYKQVVTLLMNSLNVCDNDLIENEIWVPNHFSNDVIYQIVLNSLGFEHVADHCIFSKTNYKYLYDFYRLSTQTLFVACQQKTSNIINTKIVYVLDIGLPGYNTFPIHNKETMLDVDEKCYIFN